MLYFPLIYKNVRLIIWCIMSKQAKQKHKWFIISFHRIWDSSSHKIHFFLQNCNWKRWSLMYFDFCRVANLLLNLVSLSLAGVAGIWKHLCFVYANITYGSIFILQKSQAHNADISFKYNINNQICNNILS